MIPLKKKMEFAAKVWLRDKFPDQHVRILNVTFEENLFIQASVDYQRIPDFSIPFKAVAILLLDTYYRDENEDSLVGEFMNQINLYHQQGIHYFKGRIRYYNKDDLNTIRTLLNNLKLRFKVKYRTTTNFINVEVWLD